jgi:hypothetical protein
MVIADAEAVLGPDVPAWLVERLKADMLARHHLGIERYGEPLRVDGERSASVDCYEEALDACAYSRRRFEQTGSSAWGRIAERSVELAAAIRFQLALERAEVAL